MALEGIQSLQSYQNDALISLSTGISDIAHEIDNSLRSNNNDLVLELSYFSSEIQDSISKIISNSLHQHKQVIEELKSMSYLLQSPRQTESDELTKIGLNLLSINENEEAIKILNEALEINPMNYKPYFALAHHYFENGDLLLAFQNAEKCSKRLEYMPDNPLLKAQPYQIMAKFYATEGKYKEATKIMENALNLQFQNPVDKANLIYEIAQYSFKAYPHGVLNETRLRLAIRHNPHYFGLAALDSTFKGKEYILSKLKEDLNKEIMTNLSNWNEISKCEQEIFHLINKGIEVFNDVEDKPYWVEDLNTLKEEINKIINNQNGVLMQIDKYRNENNYLSLTYIPPLIMKLSTFNNANSKIGEIIGFFLEEINSKQMLVNKSSIEYKEKSQFHLEEYNRYKNSLGNFLGFTTNAKTKRQMMESHFNSYESYLSQENIELDILETWSHINNTFIEIQEEYKSLMEKMRKIQYLDPIEFHIWIQNKS